MRSAVILVITLGVLVACASDGQAARAGTEPSTMRVLDSSYEFPAYLVPKVEGEEPGFSKIHYEDTASGCKGYFFFNTIALQADHENYVKEFVTNLDKGFGEYGVSIDRATGTTTVLGTEGRTTEWKVPSRPDVMDSLMVETFLLDQGLSVVTISDCPKGLTPKQLGVVGRVLDTRKLL